MRACAVIAPASVAAVRAEQVCQLDLHGVAAHVGVIDMPAPDFDPGSAAHAHSVLLQVEAFSFNYREKSRVVKVAADSNACGYLVLGSEFGGTVLQVGSAVTSLKPGDRVCGNGTVEGGNTPLGLTTQRASAELQVIHAAKLLRVPAAMSLAEAAAFSVGAQTAYGMVRRLGAGPGDHVLVTAATSNTSLFAIKALRNRGATVHALTSSPTAMPYLRSLGVQHCCVLDRQGDHVAPLRAYLEAQGMRGFDVVIDPFMDIYLRKLIPFVNRFGTYITCGVYAQFAQADDAFLYRGLPLDEMFSLLIRKSISLVGNNLGNTDDLVTALRDYREGRLQIELDAVLSDGKLATFVERSFMSSSRRGKVVFRYGKRAAAMARETTEAAALLP